MLPTNDLTNQPDLVKFSQFNQCCFLFLHSVYWLSLFCFVEIFLILCLFVSLLLCLFVEWSLFVFLFVFIFIMVAVCLFYRLTESAKPLGGIRERLWSRLRQTPMFTNHLQTDPRWKKLMISFFCGYVESDEWWQLFVRLVKTFKWYKPTVVFLWFYLLFVSGISCH